MPSDSPGGKRAGDILPALQLRICLADPREEWMLHEGKLGLEFGVSRTPVRQVLQRLAYVRLVETRSGVGTVVTALDPGLRGRDMAMLRGALRLALDCAPADLPLQARADLAGLAAYLPAAPAGPAPGPDEAAAHFRARARVLALVGGLILDPVLAEAHEAMHWRAIRWRMDRARRAPQAAHADLAALVARLGAAAAPSEVFDALAREPDPDVPDPDVPEPEAPPPPDRDPA